MKKNTDILCFNSIKATNGPVIIHRSVLKFHAFFLKRGYNVSIIFKEGIFDTEYIPNQTPQNHNFDSKLAKIKYSFKSKVIGFYRSISILNSLSYYYFDFSLKLKVKRYLKLNRNPEIVVTDSEREMYHFLKNNKNNTKTVLFMHSDGVPLKMITLTSPNIEKTFFYKRMKKRYLYTIKNVDRIVFICDIGMQNFIKSYPDFDRSKLSVVLNGIEEQTSGKTETNSVSQSTFNLSCVGSVSHRKGQDIIINALACADRSTIDKIHVNIIGDGPARKEIEELIRSNNLTENVSMLGAIDNSKVRKYLSNSNIFILTSRNEGLPISIIEAMREGLAIISTNISGIPELVENNYNGLLIDPSVEQLKDIFNNIDSYNWEIMGENSLKLFNDKFTLDRVFSEYCDIYDSLTK
jgi:glycosyltransferase involved in cell wall biosynthesis